MLVRVHPDVSRMIERWGRPHHYVDYRRFKDNPRLRLRDDPEPPPPSWAYTSTRVPSTAAQRVRSVRYDPPRAAR